jgi:SAM-dependent methyltransferase
MTRSSRLQDRYYEQTAHFYDEIHVREGDEHLIALRYVSGFAKMHGYRSVLDVRCGTGRAIRYFLEKNPEIEVCGIEPEGALARRALEYNLIPATLIKPGVGEKIPFQDQSFDAVCEFGVLPM